jgi:hypothetical protein
MYTMLYLLTFLDPKCSSASKELITLLYVTFSNTLENAVGNETGL